MAVGATLTGISKVFRGRGPDVHALRSIDAVIAPGEFVNVVGHNGSGKSTLLRVLSGDVFADAGSVWLETRSEDGHVSRRNVTHTPVEERAGLIGFVHQRPGAGTFGELEVWENIRIASLKRMGFAVGRPTAIPALSVARLDAAGISNEKLRQPASLLSGGQRQVLALEMAALRSPGLLLLDEHTASLDRRNARVCMELTAAMAREANMAVLNVTHNLSDAIEFGDTIWIMLDGRLIERITGAEKRALGLLELLEIAGFAESADQERDLTTKSTAIEWLAAKTSGKVARNVQALLGPFLTALDELGRVGRTPAPAVEEVWRIQSHVKTLSELGEDLIRLSRRGGRLKRRPVQIAKLVDEQKVLFGEARLSVRHHAEATAWIDGSWEHLSLAVANLITNALKATKAAAMEPVALLTGSVVVDKIRRCHLGLGFIVPGRYAFIEVTDCGPGMDLGSLEQAFDARGASERSGSIPGLTIVAAMVDANNGVLDLQSRPGRTSFTLYFPAIEPPRASTENEDQAERQRHGSQ